MGFAGGRENEILAHVHFSPRPVVSQYSPNSRMQDAGGNEYPSNEQQTNMKWFCNLSHVDLVEINGNVCARVCVGAQGVTAPCRR